MRCAEPISVVIPCYNAVRYIGAALESVLSQDGVQLDVNVVDDGSSDGSADLVAERFPRVRLHRQPNQGVAAARNRGIAEAGCDWVAFLDADDLWLPGKLAAQLSALRAATDARMCYAAWHVWAGDNPWPAPAVLADMQHPGHSPSQWSGPSGWIYPELLLDCAVWTSTVLVRRELLVELGGFDTSLPIGEDYDLWLRASQVTPILRVPQPLAIYRQHPASITRSAPTANHRAEVIGRALRRWGYRSADGRSAAAGAVAHALAVSWCDYGGAHLGRGASQVARHAAARAVRADPRCLAGWKLLLKSTLRSLSAQA